MTGITITSGFQQEHKFKPTPKLFYDERFEKKDKKVFDFLNYRKQKNKVNLKERQNNP